MNTSFRAGGCPERSEGMHPPEREESGRRPALQWSVGAQPPLLSHPPGNMGTMDKKNQLALLARDDAASWELDEHTRQIGKQGIAAAREALQRAAVRRAA